MSNDHFVVMVPAAVSESVFACNLSKYLLLNRKIEMEMDMPINSKLNCKEFKRT